MEEYREIEKSIIKKYRKTIWSKFVKAIKAYDLIKENDTIAVCISGGKDSMLLAKCMQELQRHGQFKFNLKFITMDPGYSEENVNNILDNAKKLNIDINIFKTDIFSVVSKIGMDSPCYLCARMRRGHLYNKAKELGCNKIALAHHFDDVVETIMMNILYNGKYGSMMPKLHSDNFNGMELIRPLYYVEEESIKAWVKSNELNFIDCGCMITVCSSSSKRSEIKELINSLNKVNPNAAKNIFKSSENINLNTVIKYCKDKEEHHFLDEYNK
ncbi:MAG: ATP-binding protein [Bacilli bacterium]|nr:ATP-binding protein [Bacilli bacterium]